MANEHLSLKWNNHGSTFLKAFSLIQQKGTFSDITIVCEENFYSLHKLVLSSCSEYFEVILNRTEIKNPIIVLSGIKTAEFEALINYMYVGEVNVIQRKLSALIQAAEALKIKGLAVPDDNSDKQNKDGVNDSPKEQNAAVKREKEDVKQIETNDKNISDNNHIINEAETNIIDMSCDNEQEAGNSRTHTNADIVTDVKQVMMLEESAIKTEVTYVDVPEYSHEALTEDSVLCETVLENESLPQSDMPGVSSVFHLEQNTNLEQVAIDEPPDTNSMDTISHNNSSTIFPSKNLMGVPLDGFDPITYDHSLKGPKKRHCPFCPYNTAIKSHYTDHIRAHTGEKPFQCDICLQRFSQKSHMKTHRNMHTNRKVYRCTKCSFASLSKGPLKKHKITVHKEAPPTKAFKCLLCSYSTVTSKGLKTHMSQRHVSAMLVN